MLKAQWDKKLKKRVGVSWFPSKCKPTPLCVCVYMVKWRPMLCLWTATVAGRIFQPQVIFRMRAGIRTHTHTCAHTHTHTLMRILSFKPTHFFINNVPTWGHVKQWDSVPVFNSQTESRNKDTEKRQTGTGRVGIRTRASLTWWEVHCLACSTRSAPFANTAPLHMTGCTTWNAKHACTHSWEVPKLQKSVQLQTYWENHQHKQNTDVFMNIITFAKDLSVWLVAMFICLSEGLQKNCLSNFHDTWWKGVAPAKEEPIQFWSGSKSQGRTDALHFSLLSTLRDLAFAE